MAYLRGRTVKKSTLGNRPTHLRLKVACGSIRDRSLRAENRSMSAVPRKRQTCATQWAPIRFGSAGCVPLSAYPTILAPTLFPMAQRGLRWRPNVPSHGQRDRDKAYRIAGPGCRSDAPQPRVGESWSAETHDVGS